MAPTVQKVMLYSPLQSPMELIRKGIFGDHVDAIWNLTVPLSASLVLLLIGLVLCRRIRRTLVVE